MNARNRGAGPALSLVPYPRRVATLGGRAALPGELVCEGVVEGRGCFWRLWYASEVAAPGQADGASLRVRVGERLPAADGHGIEGAYLLRLDDDPMLLAETEAGVWAGLQTLKQLACNARPGRVPRVEIRDWPAAQWRGFQLDLARQMAYRPDFMRGLCGQLAALKFNVLQLYIEHNFAWDAFPELAEVDAMTPNDARELEDIARMNGIAVIPATNVCRHMEGFLRHPRFKHLKELPRSSHEVAAGMLCVGHPEAWKLVKTILDEMLDAFSGEYIHLGFDETHFFGKHPKSLSKTPAQWYAEWIARTVEYVGRRGRRAHIWGDKFLLKEDFPEISNCNGGWPGNIREAINHVPKDVVIQDWHYESSGDASIRFFRDKGFETWAAGSIRTPAHFMAPVEFQTMPQFYANAVRAGARGVMVTSWGYSPGFRLDDRWPSLALSAEAAWRGEAPDLTDFNRRWSGLRHGRNVPVVPILRTLSEKVPGAFDRFGPAQPPWKMPWGQQVRTMLLSAQDPFDIGDHVVAASPANTGRARKTVERARRRLAAVAARAERNRDEIEAWGYYLDLYDHFLNRLTKVPEIGRLYGELTNKMNPKVYSMRERRRVLKQIRGHMESLYDEALGFLRIQRRLCAEDGMPVRDLHAMRGFLRNLAAAIQKVREMEETGVYCETPDVFGRWL